MWSVRRNVAQRYVLADTFFYCTLARCPGHPLATQGRARTKLVVDQLYLAQLQEVCLKQTRFQKILVGSPVLHNSLLHNYYTMVHSTVLLKAVQQILEKGGPISGRTALECQEVLGIYAGFNLMCELLKEGRSKKISLKDILDLHSHVLSGTDPKPSRLYSIPVLRNIFKPQKIAGVLRKQQVYIGRNNFIPANHKLVPAKMDDFITWFNNCILRMQPLLSR
uniref:Uncharacterized protein n=1 Tax=Ditylenchus dipsaci TaxID=166011 RepID=A0A915EDC3_9BILA